VEVKRSWAVRAGSFKPSTGRGPCGPAPCRAASTATAGVWRTDRGGDQTPWGTRPTLDTKAAGHSARSGIHVERVASSSCQIRNEIGRPSRPWIPAAPRQGAAGGGRRAPKRVAHRRGGAVQYRGTTGQCSDAARPVGAALATGGHPLGSPAPCCRDHSSRVSWRRLNFLSHPRSEIRALLRQGRPGCRVHQIASPDHLLLQEAGLSLAASASSSRLHCRSLPWVRAHTLSSSPPIPISTRFPLQAGRPAFCPALQCGPWRSMS